MGPRSDHVRGRFRPRKRFRLNAKMRLVATHSTDPMVRGAQNALEALEFSEVLGTRYSWKYLPDEKFTELAATLEDPYKINHLFVSHLARVIEAFEIVSVWRASELVGSCVSSLNNDQLVAAATLSRALLELTIVYGEAVNRLRHHFDTKFPWHQMHSHVIGMDFTDPTGRKVGLESYIERLMSGTRLSEGVERSRDMQQTNIMSFIERLDKNLAEQSFGYRVKPHYAVLSDLAHPNWLGYQRFLSGVNALENGWTERLMEERADSERSIYITAECLWALSFSAGSLDGLFGEFQKFMRGLGKRLGRILPI
jgi:hypothetical protein